MLAGGLEVVLLGWRWSYSAGDGPGASFQRGERHLLCQAGRRGVDTFSLPVARE